jgi:uncharacterized protein YcnI
MAVNMESAYWLESTFYKDGVHWFDQSISKLTMMYYDTLILSCNADRENNRVDQATDVVLQSKQEGQSEKSISKGEKKRIKNGRKKKQKGRKQSS